MGIGGIKDVVEPLAIFLIFTATTLINRTQTRELRWWSEVPTPSSQQTPLLPQTRTTRQKTFRIKHWASYPETSRFRTGLLSRFFRKFPFILEILYWACTYWPYQLLRAASAKYISSSPERKSAIEETARENAVRILNAEEWLGIAFEHRFQQFVLTRCKTWVMDAMCALYLAHICVRILFLGYGYTYFPRSKYQKIRRTIAMDNFLSFAVLTAYRCTPPRLMPESYGFVDVLHPIDEGGPNFWASNPFQLTLAAMPSLHFGTSLLIGLSLVFCGKHLLVRIISPLYPVAMFFAVLGTANHWVLDCVVGVLVVGVGWKVNWVLLGLRPVEEWLFWLCRVQKPVDEAEIGKVDSD
ncbi:PAP2 superfamily-domain-containing protein [Hyaloscypha finlandica]|nr:PAP2 superfamily-domain-containing protein [Hyaloscypha finlandica]